MKLWIKSISPNDPVMRPIMDEFGFEGYGKFIAVFEFCIDFDIPHIDLEIVKKQTRSNARGASKLLEIFQQTLDKVYPNFRQSSPKHSPNIHQTFTKHSPNIHQTFTKHSPNIDQSLPKVDDQNQHGSTRDLDKNRVEENRVEERRIPPNPQQVNLPLVDTSTEQVLSAGFIKFWEVYPAGTRKVNRAACYKAWQARKLEKIAEQIIKGVESHKNSDDWQKERGQYVPAPLVFINQSRWEAEIPKAKVDPWSHLTAAPGTIIV